MNNFIYGLVCSLLCSGIAFGSSPFLNPVCPSVSEILQAERIDNKYIIDRIGPMIPSGASINLSDEWIRSEISAAGSALICRYTNRKSLVLISSGTWKPVILRLPNTLNWIESSLSISCVVDRQICLFNR